MSHYGAMDYDLLVVTAIIEQILVASLPFLMLIKVVSLSSLALMRMKYQHRLPIMIFMVPHPLSKYINKINIMSKVRQKVVRLNLKQNLPELDREMRS